MIDRPTLTRKLDALGWRLTAAGDEFRAVHLSKQLSLAAATPDDLLAAVIRREASTPVRRFVCTRAWSAPVIRGLSRWLVATI